MHETQSQKSPFAFAPEGKFAVTLGIIADVMTVGSTGGAFFAFIQKAPTHVIISICLVLVVSSVVSIRRWYYRPKPVTLDVDLQKEWIDLTIEHCRILAWSSWTMRALSPLPSLRRDLMGDVEMLVLRLLNSRLFKIGADLNAAIRLLSRSLFEYIEFVKCGNVNWSESDTKFSPRPFNKCEPHSSPKRNQELAKDWETWLETNARWIVFLTKCANLFAEAAEKTEFYKDNTLQEGIVLIDCDLPTLGASFGSPKFTEEEKRNIFSTENDKVPNILEIHRMILARDIRLRKSNQ